jgi:hypothetical protein
MTGGYVALLDVLGFSNLVAEDRDGSALRRYLDCLNALAEGDTGYVVFSDSIVLTVEGSEPDKLLRISQACSRLMAELIDKDIPVRGAIACGEFFRTSVGRSVFIAGRAILDAYHYEQLQNWIGIMLAPSAQKAVRELDLETLCYRGALTCSATGLPDNIAWPACIQKCTQIPIKQPGWQIQAWQEGFAIFPGRGNPDPPQMHSVYRNTVARLNWQRSVAPSPDAQLKYKNTLDWLSAFEANLSGLAQAYAAMKAL